MTLATCNFYDINFLLAPSRMTYLIIVAGRVYYTRTNDVY